MSNSTPASFTQSPVQAQSHLLDELKKAFPGRIAISRSEMRELLGISSSLDCRIKRTGNYPKLILFPAPAGTQHYQQVLLTDLAEWLASMRVEGQATPALFKDANPLKKRGRPVGSKNKPKTPQQDSSLEESPAGAMPF